MFLLLCCFLFLGDVDHLRWKNRNELSRQVFFFSPSHRCKKGPLSDIRLYSWLNLPKCWNYNLQTGRSQVEKQPISFRSFTVKAILGLDDGWLFVLVPMFAMIMMMMMMMIIMMVVYACLCCIFQHFFIVVFPRRTSTCYNARHDLHVSPLEDTTPTIFVTLNCMYILICWTQ